ncbi:MAG: hypothetical protein E5V75_35505, partial [Mesorhizobium sp.]
AASFEPGASVSEVARSAGIHVSQLFRWRKSCVIRSTPVPRNWSRWRSSLQCRLPLKRRRHRRLPVDRAARAVSLR